MKVFKDRRGLTLIEVLIASTIFALVISVAYPMLNISVNFSNAQMRETNYRNDVRVVSTYLTNDIRNSNDILVDNREIVINTNDGDAIKYTIKNNDYLVREINGSKKVFDYIKDVNFELQNDNLVVSKFISQENIFTQFSVFSGSTGIDKKPEQDVDDGFLSFLVSNNVFVFSNKVNLNGNVKVDGPLSTVIANNSLEQNGNVTISVKNKYVNSNEIPRYGMPLLKLDSWYNERGYTSSATPRSNMKYIGVNWNVSGNITAEDVIIVSKRDINVSGNTKITGVLFAPNGTVTIQGNVKFDGIIIANEVIIRGNASIKHKPVNIETLPF